MHYPSVFILLAFCFILSPPNDIISYLAATGTHNQEPATPLISQCNSMLQTSLFLDIFPAKLASFFQST